MFLAAAPGGFFIGLMVQYHIAMDYSEKLVAACAVQNTNFREWKASLKLVKDRAEEY